MVSNKGNSYELSAGLLNIFSYNDTYIQIVFDVACSGASYLNKAVSLKITRASDNSGGTITCSDIINFTGSNKIAKFAINTYVEGSPGCSFNDIKTAFENGATLNFEMKTQ